MILQNVAGLAASAEPIPVGHLLVETRGGQFCSAVGACLCHTVRLGRQSGTVGSQTYFTLPFHTKPTGWIMVKLGERLELVAPKTLLVCWREYFGFNGSLGVNSGHFFS
jgi:hypothetical protein